jgi:hypothetical protein
MPEIWAPRMTYSTKLLDE